MAGMTPQTASEINISVGTILRQFVDVKESIGHVKDNLAGVDLKEPPYDMTPEDETLVKSAINDLDTALDAVDMVWINRLTGLW